MRCPPRFLTIVRMPCALVGGWVYAILAVYSSLAAWVIMFISTITTTRAAYFSMAF
ncbi:MAG: hypothetical protein U1E91_03625 [Moraxella sp.]